MNRNLWVAVVVVVVAAAGSISTSARPNRRCPISRLSGANLIEGLGDYSMPVTAKNAGRAALVRPGPGADLRLQPRRRRALVPEGRRTRSGLRDVLVGRGAGARAARERGMDPANNAKAWDRLQRAQRAASKATDKEQAFIEALVGALCGEPARGPPAARRGLRGRDGRARGQVPRRPRRGDAARRGDDGPAALGLLGRDRPAEGPYGRDRLDARVGDGAQPGPRRRAAPVRARGRGLAGSVEAASRRRTRCASCCRAPATSCTCRRTSTRASAAGTTPCVANQNAIGADDAYLAICKPGPGRVPARLRAAQPSLPLVRGDHGRRERSGARRRRAHRRAHERPAADAHAGLRGDAELLADAALCRVRFGHWDEVVAMPKPADDLPYMQAMWNYGQAMAAVSQGRLDDAKQFHAALEPATHDPAIEKMLAWDRYSLIGGVQVAERFVAAAIARAEKRLRRRRSRRSTPRSRSRTRCPTTSRRPGTGRRARRSATCCSRRASRRRPSRRTATSSRAIRRTAGRCTGWRAR